MTAQHKAAASLGLVTLVILATAAVQRREVDTLRTVERDLRSELANTNQARLPAAPPAVSTGVPQSPLSEAENLELMRLRAEVTRLHARQRDLANVRVENQNLQARLAAKSAATNTPPGGSVLPPDYIKGSTAQNMGFATPEAALQTLFWAMAHADTNLLFQALSPEAAERTRQEYQSNPEEFLHNMAAIPGFLIKSRETSPDGSVSLKVTILPSDISGQDVKAHQIDGQWRIDLR